MNAVADIKVCPHCAETIKVAAKVCPHCRLWQNRWSLYNPFVILGIYVIVVALVIGYFGVLFDQKFGSHEDFAEFRNKISAVSSQVSMRTTGSNVFVTVAGILTNKSNISWKEVGVEAQFLDKSGKLFDVITVKANDYNGIGMLPHSEGAFKVEGRAARPEADYNHYNIIVRWAKDARVIW
jgi:hypothetical protein